MWNFQTFQKNLLVQNAQEKFPTPCQYDELFPIVEKVVDAGWNNDMIHEKLALSKGRYNPLLIVILVLHIQPLQHSFFHSQHLPCRFLYSFWYQQWP